MLEVTAGGSRAGTPRTQSFPQQRGGEDTPPHFQGAVGQVLPSWPLPAPAQSAGHEVHTLEKSKSKTLGNQEIRGLVMGALLRGPMAVAAWVWKGSLGLSEPWLPQLQGTPQKVQSPPRNVGPPVFSLEVGRVPRLSF